MKRAPNHSELVDFDIENEKEIPVTMDFADTLSDEDENEEIEKMQFQNAYTSTKNYLYYSNNLFDI